ncbi:MAG: response regulator, partial [Desulfobulbaceae bacterium]|nr:response regulator [Desulfobulbaceae bacterium]
MRDSELQTILIVDDTPSNISILGKALQDEYKIKVATSGADALNKASQDKPDLILLDVMMPKMSGYEVCRRFKQNAATRKIPVIFVTALTDIGDETKGFAAGAVDYITKPISPPIVRARVKTHLALFDQNRILAEQVKARTEEISFTQDVTIASLATLAEYRDPETGGHIKRTQHYVRVIAEYLMRQPSCRACRDFDQDDIDTLVKSAPLHDIGKVGISDAILLKPGKLSKDEFEEMKNHTVYGEMAILKAEAEMGERRKSSFLRFGREIAASHHENWDGSGYP